MLLTLSEFNEQARQFAELSASIGDNWQLKEVEDDVFIYKRSFQEIPGVNAVATAGVLETRDAVNECDSQTVKHSETLERTHLTWDYNIVYNISYQVPALYFNVYKANMTLLSLDEIWEMFCSREESFKKMDMWNTITQQEHPVTRVPHFVIHPCNTQNIMRVLRTAETAKSRANYLVTWLSSVGQVIGVRVPLAYNTCK